MLDKIANAQDRPEEKPSTEQELQPYDPYVNGGLGYAGRPKKCFMEAFGEDTVKDPYASANCPTNKPHVPTHIKALLSPERFEIETMAVKLQVTETLKAVMDGTATSDYTDRFGVLLSPVLLRAALVNAARALMGIFPVRHKEENRLRVEGNDSSIIFDVIVPQNPIIDGEKET